MPLIQHETLVAAPIAKVWLFFTDPVKNLPRISTPSQAVVIKSADLPLAAGSKLVVAAKDPLGRRTEWHLQVEQFEPPHPVVFGFEARFVDVQLSGPFRSWRHEHELEAVDSRTTRMIDRVTYQPSAGLLGMLTDWLFVRWYLMRMFRQRGRALKEILGEQ